MHVLVKRFACLIIALVLAACGSVEPRPGDTSVDERLRAANAETTIALLGATGMVGGYLLDQALERGYRVRALARTPAKLAAYEGRIAIVHRRIFGRES